MRCDTPYYVLPNRAATEKIPVPCGKCPPCKQRRVDTWVFRLMQEDKCSISAHFVTLTYDTRAVPITRNGFMTLDKTDVQKFFKRLRKKIPEDIKIRYYLAGEYGTQNHRPHYHAIIFNCADIELYNEAWQKGDVHVGKVSGDSIAYTCKYINKEPAQKRHNRDDRKPEFSLMSKGIGANYLTDEIIEYHKQNIGIMYVTKLSGHKVPMPRYYRNKIFTKQELQQQIGIIQHNVEKQELDDRKRHRLSGDKRTFEQKQDALRFERYKRFYHTLNKRQ